MPIVRKQKQIQPNTHFCFLGSRFVHFQVQKVRFNGKVECSELEATHLAFQKSMF